ncbi:hypothetical protein N8I77_006258 [Diaporthe amygdali]|uniref:Cytochrome P450 n=1 Tax=Phomopsis amygdali TaxID=1214568 RepID=A0AAD9SH01_PHOAM|nr:hypothetical protein N8I77_006258 [Diaporthe amygdali]
MITAATPWYETAIDLWNHNFPGVLKKMHEKHDQISPERGHSRISDVGEGPIVRVSPWELHIYDPDYFNNVFVTSAKRRTTIEPREGLLMDCKYMSSSYREGIIFDAILVAFPLTPGHELHHQRRRPIEKVFSRQSIISYEWVIQKEIRLLEEKLLAVGNTTTPLRLDHAFAAFAGDIIGELACGKNPQLMNGQYFTPEWQVPDKLLRIDLTKRPKSLLQLIPIKLLKALSPKTASFSIMAVVSHDPLHHCFNHELLTPICKLGVTQIEKIKKEVALQAKDQAEESQSVFHSLLRSDMPPAELSDMRLSADAMALLAAGTATTSSVLTLISFYIISESRIRNRLRDELGVAMAGVPPGKLLQWTRLEKIPYLNACIKEGVRWVPLFPTDIQRRGKMCTDPQANRIGRTFRRNGRISPDQELQYKGYTIPKNTLVSMSLSLQHVDPAVFPEPNRFRPERWLGEYDPRMDDYMQPFSKGSRDCLGKKYEASISALSSLSDIFSRSLARAELYIAIGTLFRPGGPRLTISGCDESDIFPVNDKEWGVPKSDSRGLNVCVG